MPDSIIAITTKEAWELAAESLVTQRHAWTYLRPFHFDKDGVPMRNQGLLPACELANGQFSVELVETDEQIREAFDLFTGALKPEEVEPFERFTLNVKGVLIGNRVLRYRSFLVREKATCKAVAAHAGVLGSLRQSKKAVFVGSYAATLNEYRRLGLMQQLFASSLAQAAIDAHARSEELAIVVGDCTEQSEPTWNATGRKKVYIEVGPGKYKQVAYKQPSLKFDLVTGEPTEDAGPVAENLMIRTLGCELTRDLIRESVHAIYLWSGKRPESDFASHEAYRNYKLHFTNLLRDFDKGLKDARGDLVQFSAAERMEKMEEGCTFT